MLRYLFVFCCGFALIFADYNNITLEQLLKKTALLNNINIVMPDTNLTKTYTITINNYITAKDLLNASKALLQKNGYTLQQLNKSFYIVSKTIDKRYNYIYKVKNSNSSNILKKLNTIYPTNLYKLNNRFILIKYSNKKILRQILSNIKTVDISSNNYYVAINIYNTDTNALENLGININNLNINKNTGTLLLNKSITPNLLPTLITLLRDNKKSTLISSPKLFLNPDTNTTATFKEVTTVPITIKKTQIIPGTNPVVTNTSNTIYKEVGLMLQLKYINSTQDNKVKFLLSLTDSNIISYTENGITTSNRNINIIVQAQINKPIFIAGLNKNI
ncbi:hypothetical protein, partial [Thermococcus sp.]|uniref:hypothetical protein n=1 Tax=Thermococcus sp. TaxID=35749 RepID=UPI00260FCD4E